MHINNQGLNRAKVALKSEQEKRYKNMLLLRSKVFLSLNRAKVALKSKSYSVLTTNFTFLSLNRAKVALKYGLRKEIICKKKHV